MRALADLASRDGHHEEADAWYRAARDERLARGPYVTNGPAEPLVTTLLITAAELPFLQTLMTRAGESGYNAVRAAIRRLGGRRRARSWPLSPMTRPT